jgi:putative ABC transport system permease protein
MMRLVDIVSQSADALKAHKLRAALTTLGLTMGVATLITVMTIVQGANLYVEQKIANLGTNVFKIARTPFAVTDFNLVIKALKYKKLYMDDVRAVAAGCPHCELVGAAATATVRVRYQDKELQDINYYGYTANMADIDTRTLENGRYFTDVEDERGANVCVAGSVLIEQFFPGGTGIGSVLRVGKDEYTIIGTFEKIGSILGQDQDNFMVVPMNVYLRSKGRQSPVTINVKASGDSRTFERAIDEARLVLRARRHITGNKEEDFFIGTSDSYMALWQSISGAFFSVFIMVSSISAIVGGIVIMNVMLVSVTERTKEIGVRRALGATQADVRRQFLTESIMQCVVGGLAGIGAGFLFALVLRNFTSFPASVQTWVAVLGVVLSSIIGLFFGIYPAVRASKLDPVVALRAD